MTSLKVIEGVGDKYMAELKRAGIGTAEALLMRGATPQGRKAISEKSGISEKLLLEWVNHVDLFRIKGVGEEYADLLEEAGVDTVPELAQRVPQNLLEKMIEINASKKLVRQMPTLQKVYYWVEQAKKLNRIIQY
jgi:predicted flap endonuclease-1-like 5' DNA nuclease